MNTESNGIAGYKVGAVATAKATMRRIHGERMLAGKGTAFLAILRSIYDRLRTNPREFGEPLYRMPALHLTVFQGVINSVVVTYGVHDELPLVMIRVVKLLSDPEK